MDQRKGILLLLITIITLILITIDADDFSSSTENGNLRETAGEGGWNKRAGLGGAWSRGELVTRRGVLVPRYLLRKCAINFRQSTTSQYTGGIRGNYEDYIKYTTDEV